jgi:sulfate-transporting ATPase
MGHAEAVANEVSEYRVQPQELEVRGITVRFGGVTAVDNVSLTVRPGEIVGLIGPNGAGKSTLIDTITGFSRPSAGTIRLGENDLTRLPVHKRVYAGLVRSWQSLEIFEDISVLENLEAGFARPSLRAQFVGLFRPHRNPLSDAALKTVGEFGLDSDLQRSPDELSFSQRRILSTARSIALNPSVLLLDEPAAGMSDVRRAALAKVVTAMARDRGMGVLLVDHDMPFVMGLCDRIVVLNFGAKIAEGSPAEIRSDPNVIAAYLRGDADVHEEGDAAARVPASTSRQAAPRTDVLLAARNMAVGYYGHPVVQGIHLDLHAGEVIALLGANRAGKTTTLLALAGVNAPLDGTVYWLGERVTKRVALNRLAEQGLGFLTEERSVFRQLTVAENLRVGGCDVDDALSLFPELEEPLKRRRKVGLLSGGQQQMLGLARALARHPKVLLVDEMSLGLAPMMVTRLMDAMREAADRGVGVILVEQHVPQALRIADHVCVLASGQMTLSGSVSEVGDRVDAAFLADVLGQPASAGAGRDSAAPAT